MKKLGTLLVLMSLSLFTIGCAPADDAGTDTTDAPAAENGNGDESMDEGSAGDEAAGEEAAGEEAAAGEEEATE